jgi:hypothetical protein
MGIARSTPAQRRRAHDDLIRGTPIPSGRGKGGELAPLSVG